MGKMLDLTGQKFGKLTVISCAGKLDGRRYSWNCQCDCGNTCVVLSGRLRNGNTKSCGCGKYDGLKQYNLNQSEKNKILIGTKFGKLTVIEDLGFRPQVEGHTRRWYKCECECGNIKEIMGNMLKQGQTSSCGLCNFNSRGEYEIFKLLSENNIKFKYDIPFDDLSEESGRRLRFDFIIFNDNNKPIRFIEFDGRQHFTGPDTSYWGHSQDTLKTILEKDQIKNQFCLKHNYPLVRIPYTVKKICYDDIFTDKYIVKGE